MGSMRHLVFLIFSLIIAFSHVANSHSITELLDKGGLTTFSSLINKTGVVEAYDAALKKNGLTIFAPSNEVFASPTIVAALKKLTPDQVVALLKYHAVGKYEPIEKLKEKNGPIATLAKDGDKYTLKATNTGGDEITLIAGEDSSRIVKTIVDDKPLVIFKIENVLLPSEIFGKSPSPDVNIAELLEKAGLTTFSSLINETGVLEAYNSALKKKGLTIFAPSNEVFASPTIVAALKKLTPDQVVALLKYHAVGKYEPIEKLKEKNGPIATLAKDGDKYTLKATNTGGDEITLIAGEDSSKIVKTIVDDKPLVIFRIENVLLPSEIFGKPSSPDVNITELLGKAGLTTFSSLIKKTGVLEAYNSALKKKGLTIFAPSNEVFASPPIQAALKKLTPDQVVALLKYHAVGKYEPIEKLKAKNGPIATLAKDGDKYTLKATNTGGDEITLIAGEDSSRIVKTIVDDKPLVIFMIENVLLPSEIFGKPPAPSVNIAELLNKGGLMTFSSLINKTGVLEAYNSALKKKGLTIFAPSNEVFASPPIQAALKKLTPDQVVALLKYHAVGKYEPIEALKAKKGPISTLAKDGKKYTLKAINTGGDKITLIAGEDLVQIDKTIIDDKPLVIFKIDNVLLPSEIFGKPPRPDVNIAELLEKAGLTTFASLIVKTDVVKEYLAAEKKKGVTIFAPSNAAFGPATLAALKKLKPDQVVALLKYHAVRKYIPFETLKERKGPISTLAKDGYGRYFLKAKTDGDKITLIAGEDKVPIDKTIIDNNPLVIFQINNVLLPSEIFGKSPAPAVSPACN